MYSEYVNKCLLYNPLREEIQSAKNLLEEVLQVTSPGL